MPFLGQALPKTPEVVAGKLIGLWRGDGDDLVSARVERLGDALDVSTLAGGVPALLGKDDRNLPAVDLIVQFVKLFLVVLERFLVFAATKLLVKGDLL